MEPAPTTSRACDGAPAPSIALGIPLDRDAPSTEAVVRRIREEFIRATPHLEPGSVFGATPYDLVRLFTLYDEHAFGGHLARRSAELGHGATRLAFNGRLTASSGRTGRFVWREGPSPSAPTRTAYRIEISTPLVVDSFVEGAREVHSGGIVCKDQLDAVQRVLEHEMVHLLELLARGHSDCAAPNFLWLVSRLFGHTAAGHGLVTPRERARQSGLRVGDRVAFEHDGVRHDGWIASIRRRATVLVEQPGAEYALPRVRKFHVPLGMLTRLEW